MRAWIAMVVLCVGCSGDGDVADWTGRFVSTCDETATIDFGGDGTANVRRNFCQGYADEPWEYGVDGDTLTLAPEGRLGEPGAVQEEFEIRSSDEIVLQSDSSFIACGNCVAGDAWRKQ